MTKPSHLSTEEHLECRTGWFRKLMLWPLDVTKKLVGATSCLSLPMSLHFPNISQGLGMRALSALPRASHPQIPCVPLWILGQASPSRLLLDLLLSTPNPAHHKAPTPPLPVQLASKNNPWGAYHMHYSLAHGFKLTLSLSRNWETCFSLSPVSGQGHSFLTLLGGRGIRVSFVVRQPWDPPQ